MCFPSLLKSSIGTLTALQKVLTCHITMLEFSVVFAPGAQDISQKKSCSLLRGDGKLERGATVELQERDCPEDFYFYRERLNMQMIPMLYISNSFPS